jgi:alkylhydroperoxidase family enzyme
MIKLLARRALKAFSQRYRYDTGYLEALLAHDPGAFLKFSLVNIPAAHRRGIPAAPWWAARIRAALWEDCGPCVQLVCNMALEEDVEAATVAAIVAADVAALDEETALALQFAEAVLAHDSAADTLRRQVCQRWSQRGLISLAMAISLSRVYPSVKYTLGHGHHCSLLKIAQRSIAPVAFHSITMPNTTSGALSQ